MEQVLREGTRPLCIRKTLEHAYDIGDEKLALEMSKKIDLMQLGQLVSDSIENKPA